MSRNALLGIAAAAAMSASPVSAGEYTLFTTLCLPDIQRESPAGCLGRALLNVPAGWQLGSSAVALLTAASVPDAPRDPLVAALLSANVAVLEVVPATLAHVDEAAPDQPVEPVTGMLAALLALKHGTGAGTVVAIGLGRGAHAAIDAASEREAARRLDGRAERYAAAMALHEGPAAYALGGGETNQFRLAVICEALAHAAGTPVTAAEPLVWADDCYAALVGRARPGLPATARLPR
ncbi:MAG: hypothetical protein MUC89_22500 [Acetobacteraceae bacterium]|jgi:hypothetical protein|nr:hypothetical protein [Acetobacteraceae bacterium]